jgi:DNA invertase Pin-like site-specific DNA recombinase
MPRAAIYARYSTDEQRDTSLEDQVRRCREEAAKRGFDVPDVLVFSDAALSGTAAAVEKRAGYRALINAWEQKSFEAVIVDEVSRLARDPLELAKLQQRVEASRVRLITADGIDSVTPNWQLPFGLAGIVGAHFLRETKHRVIRGMQGALERGFQIADAPIGYIAVRECDSSGAPVGTRWEIDQEKAEIVREMFEMRRNGMSLFAIAKEFNGRGIRPPRRARDGGHGYWRPSSLRRVYTNTIYRGVFTWNGSTFTYYRARKTGAKVEPVEYERPELRIVDDETWRICAGQSSATRFRGGRKHLFSGLATCGDCGNKLHHKVAGNRSTLYCAVCSQAVRVGVRPSWMGYAGAGGLRAALLLVIERLFDDALVAEFRARLRKRLEGDRSYELETAQAAARRARASYERLLRLARELPEDDVAMERELKAAALESRDAERKVRAVHENLSKVDRASIERQLVVDPRELLPRLLDDGAPVGKVQAVLQRLFPRIALVAKGDRRTRVYEISLAPGVAFANASDTPTVEEATVTVRVRVFSGAKGPTRWHVEFEVTPDTECRAAAA